MATISGVTAQTNVQLYEQLLELDWAEADLRRVRAAYELALELHTGQIRSSGKPFIAHLIGTASVLASVGRGPEVVAAGLLHAAYANGSFGGWRGRRHSGHVRELVDRVGPDVESLVTRYTALPWGASTIASWNAAPSTVPADGVVLAMRLANEVEEHLDRAKVYTAVTPRPQPVGDGAVELARHLGETELAERLTAVNNQEGRTVPAALRHRYQDKLRTPRTHRRTVVAAARLRVLQALGRVRQARRHQ